MQEYLVQKVFDPNEVPEYKATLRPLSRPSQYTELVNEEHRVVELRELGENEAQEVRSRPHILAVEPNYTAKAPEPPQVLPAAASRLTAQQTRALHGIEDAWGRGLRGAGARVAVIDTGVHEVLATRLGGRLVARESFISGEDWRDNSPDSHGSWCISVIAAACPEAEMVSLKGLSSVDGSGTYAGIVRAVERARSLGCTHISMSLGGPGSTILDSAVNSANAAGVVVAAAAGNEQAGSSQYLADTSSPAKAAGVLCVAAMGSDMLVAPFSNWGVSVDLGAIGVYTECADPDLIPGFWNGTSMATPYVAALSALLFGLGVAHEESKRALMAGATDTAEPVYEEGHGFADFRGAISKLAPPEQEEEYYPELPRVAKGVLNKTRGDKLSSLVLTYNGVEQGVFLRKK